MKPKFLADENLDGRLLRGLKRTAEGIDIIRAIDLGLEGASDDKVLHGAAFEGRILVTQDKRTIPRHFRAFRQKSNSAGVLIVRDAAPLPTVIDDLVLIWSASDASDWQNVLFWIPFS